MKSLLTLVLLASSVSFATPVVVKGSAPAGTIISVTVGYLSTSKSFFCTHFSFEDGMRKPDLIDLEFPMKGTAAQFVVQAPEKVDNCSARMISRPGISVKFAGTSFPTELGYKYNRGIEVEPVDNDITDVQTVTCERAQSLKGPITDCPFSKVQMGPSGEINVQILEKDRT